jgi:hypothetical protein
MLHFYESGQRPAAVHYSGGMLRQDDLQQVYDWLDVGLRLDVSHSDEARAGAWVD